MSPATQTRMLIAATLHIAALKAAVAAGQNQHRELSVATAALDGLKSMSKYPVVGCSQCGEQFGPGNSGYSDCRQHRGIHAAD